MKYMRLIALALSLCLSLTLALPVCADDGNGGEEDVPVYITWTVSEDGQSATDGTRRLLRYELPVGVFFDPASVYVFDTPEDEIFDTPLHGDARDAHTVWQDDYEHYEMGVLFVDETVRASLEALADGTCAAVRGKYTAKSTQTVFSLDDLMPALSAEAAAVTTQTVSVRDLKDCPVIKLCGYDALDLACIELGGIYHTPADTWLYVDYSALPDNYFDADGRLSFRGDKTVTACPISHDLMADVEARAASDCEWRPITTYQAHEITDPFVGNGSPVAFWILFALAAFVIPCGPLVVGLVLANTGMKKKRWYVLSAAAGAWMLLSAGIMLLLIL